MSKNTAIIVGVVILLVAGAIFYYKSSSNSKSSDQQMQTATDVPLVDTASSTPADSTSPSTDQTTIKEFTVTGSAFKFEPAALTVNKGDTVKITFKNSGGNHKFVIDEFNVKTQVIASGKDTTVQFTADKAGTFQYYCSVANHKAMGMVGSLIVK